MVKITGKIMEEKLKHGWTLRQLSNNYEVSDEEFLETLKKTFSSKAYKGMLARLKKNEKIAHKPVMDEAEKVELPDDISYTELNQQPETSIEEPTVDSESSSEDSLESLQLQKEELQNRLNQLEIQHKILTSERVQIRNRISDYKAVLLDMQSKIGQYQKELEALVSELDGKFASMQTINSSISETKTSLSEVNAKIEAMQKISILLYESGDMEIDSSLEIDQPEWNCIFDTIVKDELADSLTIKQIRGLAKAVSLVQFLSTQKLVYEILFENQITEEIFYKIIKEE